MERYSNRDIEERDERMWELTLALALLGLIMYSFGFYSYFDNIPEISKGRFIIILSVMEIILISLIFPSLFRFLMKRSMEIKAMYNIINIRRKIIYNRTIKWLYVKSTNQKV